MTSRVLSISAETSMIAGNPMFVLEEYREPQHVLSYIPTPDRLPQSELR